MNEGHIFIDEQISPDTLAMVKQRLAEYKDKEKIILHIQSPGGSVYAGYNIYNALKLSGKKIETIIEGEAQSMATFIALAGDTIKICNPSVFMIHMPHSGVEGTSENFEQGASELRMIENDMIAAYAAKSKKLTPDQIREMMRKTTTLNAYQAKEYGFADEVLGSYLQAVALGQTIKKPMEKKENVFARVIKMLVDAGAPESPKAIDLKTKEGKMLHVESEDGELPGKPATIDGQPATGTYMLEDGRSVTCENGVVTSVQQAAAPVQPPPAQQPTPAPVQTMEQKLAEAQAKLALIEAEKQALEAKAKAEEQAKIAAQTAQQAAVTALGTVKKEIEALSKEPAGNQAPPPKGPSMIAPSGRGPVTAQERDRTMLFMAEHMPWIRQYWSESDIAKYASGPNMVSILETSFNYTWPGILTTEIFYKPSQQAPALADMFTIDQDIKSHKQYNLVTQLNKIVKPYTGCDRTFNGNRQLITNTTVRTKEFQVSESWCKDDFTGYLTGAFNNLAQEWLKTGIDSFDPSGTPINTVIDRLLTEAIKRDIFRRVTMAAGNSSDDDYNQIDGLWDRLIDSSGASNYCVRRAGSSLGTGSLSSGNALTYLEQAYDQSNILLKEQVDSNAATFWVTRSIWDNYYNSLIGNGAVTEQAFTNLQKGLTFLTYKGIKVRPVGLWDTFLAESDNPLFATTRHLILLTIKENHILGVENGKDLNRLEGWYERKDRKFYYEADFKLGYNYLHCDLQTIMY